MVFLYESVLLKLSGELFMRGGACVDPRAVASVAREIAVLVKKGVRVGAVIGGGNIMRGRTIKGSREDARAGHRAGMLATVVNGIMLERALVRQRVRARILCAFAIPWFAEPVDAREVARAVAHNTVMLFVGGTGAPFKSTDSATVKCAAAMGAEAIFKLTIHVDGVYTRDPRRFAGAKKYSMLSYREAREKKLEIMDGAAFKEAQERRMPIHILKWGRGSIMRVLKGKKIGSVVA